MIRLLIRVVGVGVETADMLVQEIFSRNAGSQSSGAIRRSNGSSGRER